MVSSKTIREGSGLALSSRNKYLSKSEIIIAANLYKLLKQARKEIIDNKSIKLVLKKYKKKFLEAGFTKIDYLEIRTDNLKKVNISSPNKRLFAAVFIRKTRLIDNIKI